MEGREGILTKKDGGGEHMERIKIRRLVMTGAMAAVLCVLGPWSIPVGPVPISICSLLVGLCACVGGGRQAAAAVAVYLLVGAAGLPVYSGFTSGVGHLFGATGGYFAGYLLCACMVGLCSERVCGWKMLPGLIIGTVLCYAAGTGWYMMQTHTPLGAALMSCAVPFLPGDAAKICAAVLIGTPVRQRIR